MHRHISQISNGEKSQQDVDGGHNVFPCQNDDVDDVGDDTVGNHRIHYVRPCVLGEKDSDTINTAGN